MSGRPPAVRCSRGCPGCSDCPGLYVPQLGAIAAGANGHVRGDQLAAALASASVLLAPDQAVVSEPPGDPNRCRRCGGPMILQDRDGSVSCMMCGRPAVAVRSASEAERLQEGRPAQLPGRVRKPARKGKR